jgi:outer membrane receptor protein involved in Fe transport
VTDANIQGGLFNLPTGRVRFALGADYRYDGYDLSMDSAAIPNAQGIYDASGANASPSSSGNVDVKEGYLELLVPVLKDLPLVRSFEVDPAVRVSDYNISGVATSWKVDGNWKADNWVSLRGGFEHAIKEPSVSDLFSGLSALTLTLGTTQQGLGDPCDVNSTARKGPQGSAVRQLCIQTGVPENLIDTYTYSAPGILGGVSGNPALKPETADTITFGTVFTSNFETELFRMMKLSVDYFHIKIDSAVGEPSLTDLLQSCYNINGDNPTYSVTNPYCHLFQRVSGQGSLTNVHLETLNLASYETSGVDTQFDWRIPLEAMHLPAAAGDIGVNLAVSYTQQFKIQAFSSSASLDYVGTIGNSQIDPSAISHPKWKINTTLSYDVSELSFMFRGRFISAMANSGNVGTTTEAPGIASITYFDLSVNYQVSKNFGARFGVSNLLNTQPPVWTGFGATDPATYDTLGRRFFAGFDLKL